MPHLHRGDTPDYAVDVIAAARPIGPQLTAAAGLLTMLLVAMSAVEGPLPRPDYAVDGKSEVEHPLPDEPGLLCSIGGRIVNWAAEG